MAGIACDDGNGNAFCDNIRNHCRQSKKKRPQQRYLLLNRQASRPHIIQIQHTCIQIIIPRRWKVHYLFHTAEHDPCGWFVYHLVFSSHDSTLSDSAAFPSIRLLMLMENLWKRNLDTRMPNHQLGRDHTGMHNVAFPPLWNSNPSMPRSIMKISWWRTIRIVFESWSSLHFWTVRFVSVAPVFLFQQLVVKLSGTVTFSSPWSNRNEKPSGLLWIMYLHERIQDAAWLIKGWVDQCMDFQELPHEHRQYGQLAHSDRDSDCDSVESGSIRFTNIEPSTHKQLHLQIQQCLLFRQMDRLWPIRSILEWNCLRYGRPQLKSTDGSDWNLCWHALRRIIVCVCVCTDMVNATSPGEKQESKYTLLRCGGHDKPHRAKRPPSFLDTHTYRRERHPLSITMEYPNCLEKNWCLANISPLTSSPFINQFFLLHL